MDSPKGSLGKALLRYLSSGHTPDTHFDGWGARRTTTGPLPDTTFFFFFFSFCSRGSLGASWIAPRNPLVRQVSQDIGGNTTPDTHFDGCRARGTTTGRLRLMRTGAIWYMFVRPLALGASWIAPRDPLVRQVSRVSRGNTTLTHVGVTMAMTVSLWL